MGAAGNTLNRRYRLDKQIGQGGFAKVYLATDLELGRQVAVKVLDSNWASDPEFLLRFRNEARAIAALDHPNILLIHDVGTVEDTAYLVMPYASGGTFADRMKQGRLTLDEIGFYLEQIGAALDYAHQHGIIHRDVKPTNLLLRSDGRLVLTDFGLVKLLDNPSVEALTMPIGTVAYMSPEQFQGLVSASSDIYALGVLLYQMVLGKLPYEGNTREVLVGHTQLQPAPLVNHPDMRNFDPTLVQALNQVLLKALAKRAAERFPTGLALTNAYRLAIKRKNQNYAKKPDIDDTTERDAEEKTALVPDNYRAVVGPAQRQTVPPISRPDDATELAPLKSAPPIYVAPPRPQPRREVMLQPARLMVLTEPDQGFRATFELTALTLTLGREPDNAICLPLSIVSRHHATLQRLTSTPPGPYYKIVDRKSVNHLYFKGQEVPEKVLENGDIIEIGVRGYGQYIVHLTYHAPVFGPE